VATFVVLYPQAIHHLLRSPTGVVGLNSIKRGRHVRTVARALAPKRTGRLASSIELNVKIRPSGIVVEVGSRLDYARYVHDGTGVYGPFHRPITARSGGVMRFRSGSGEFTYARTVSGTRATHFLSRALPAAL
jgi:hypothetical protein